MDLLHSWISNNSDLSQKVLVLRNKCERLCARECDVRLELENAEIQPGKKRRREVNVWLRHVELKRTEFEHISKEAEEFGFRAYCSQLSKRVDTLTKEIEDLLEHGRFLNGLLLDDFDSRRLPLVVTNFVGQMFRVNVDRISLWLRNDNVSVIGLYGMGGVGKTTLLMHIHNVHLHDSRMSRHVYWVTVSQECSLKRLQLSIAQVIGLDLSVEKDEKKRAAILHSRLTTMGPTIIFLDDMWKHFSIEEIGIPLGANSCKAILTTRLLEVCRRMGCKEAIIKVETLAGNEAWKLFIDKLENYEALSVEAQQVAELVAKECGGLPLAIITMASSMRGVYDICEWHNALIELRKPVRWMEDMANDVLPKLKFSYDRLNDEKVQRCFLSCVLYPEDYPIWRERLIELWVMEGLLDDIGSRQDQVNKGHTILNKLENSCLLESAVGSDCEWVKMHDLVRDMVILITQNYPRFLAKPGMQIEQIPGEEQWNEDLVKVSLMDNKIEEIPCYMSPRCPKLSVLLLQKNPLKGIPDSFFAYMTSLAVLDLSATRIKRLPSSISDLVSLRLLLLRFCTELIHIPSVAKLQKLRVLNLYGTWIEETPRGLECLTQLEELSCGWKLSHVCAFNKYIETQHFQQLRHYGFWLHRHSEGDCEGPCRLSNKEVVISGEAFRKMGPNPRLPHDVQSLEIGKCDMEGRSLEDIFPSLDSMMELKNLNIWECKSMEYISSTTQKCSSSSNYSPLESVEYLELSGLCDLKGLLELGGGVPPSGTFSHLKTFIIEACSNIKKLFPLNLLGQLQTLLPCLEQIQILGCEEMEEIFSVANNCSAIDVPENAYPINLVFTLPKLRVLKLWDLPKLRCIYSGLFFCSSLEKFCADECPKLNMLPLSLPFLCDSSPSSLASLPNNPHWWPWLWNHFPHDAYQLLSFVDRPQTEIPI